MTAYCDNCGDGFDPVEYVTLNFEGDNFCSTFCEEVWNEATDAEEAYNEGRYGACPVFPELD